MNKLTRLKLAFASLSVVLLSSCSSNLYTFAPNTGNYHGTAEKTAVASEKTVTAEKLQEAQPILTASEETAAPAEFAAEHSSAASALAQSVAGTTNKLAVETASNEKASKETVKQLRKDLKQLKKGVKSPDDTQAAVNKSALILIIVGLILALLGGGSILGLIGVILLVVGLVLLLLDLL